MTKRLKLFTIITALALVSMLTLQGYFLYTTYQEELITYNKDAKTALELVIPEVDDHRMDRILDYHKRDMLDSTLVTIVKEVNREGKPALVFKDPETGYRHLSYSYSKEEGEPPLTKEVMFKRLLETLLGQKGMMFSLTDEIDARRSSYVDTVAYDLDFLRARLNERFNEFGVSHDYIIDLVSEEEMELIAADSLENDYLTLESDQGVKVIFDQPVINVLKRIYRVILASVLVIILIAISFYALFKTISKQRQLSRVKDDFIDSMTHELLTPIATLKIALETLDQKEVRNDAEKAEKYLKVSKMELSRVSDIVHNVLYSSLHEQQETQLKIERVNLNELLNNLVGYHQNANEGELTIECQQLEEPWLETDKQHLTNVLHNLIDNAIKYSEGQASISIVPTRHGNELSIVVNDKGRGIPEGEQGKIFEKFYRAKAMSDVKGLGVGLYYVQSILKRLKGNIELLHSSPAGSSFRVSLNTTTSGK